MTRHTYRGFSLIELVLVVAILGLTTLVAVRQLSVYLDRIATRLPAEMNVPLVVARVAYLSGEQLPRGEEAAKRWIANPPRDATVNSRAVAHLRLGNIYEKTGRRELARSEYERAVNLNPKLDDAKKALDNVK